MGTVKKSITRYEQLTLDDKKDILTLYKEKNTPYTISEKLKITRGVVKRVLEETFTTRNHYSTLRGVYMVKNEVNGKVYIGHSTEILNTWKALMLYNKENYRDLYKDLLTYGLPAFSFRVLIEHPNLSKSQLCKLENTFIKYYDSINKGYNTSYSKDGFLELDIRGKTVDEILEYVFHEVL